MTTNLRARARLLCALGALVLLATPALAGGPRTERITGHDAFAEGTLEGLLLDADGVLRLGPSFKARNLDADNAWAATQSGGALWVGVGHPAAVVRITAEGEPKRVEIEGGFMVTALAPLPGGAVAAGVFPGGRIVKITPDGTVTAHARLPAEHIWALASTSTGALTAACGVPGSLHGVDPFGAVTKLTDIDDTHARCMTAAADGKTLYVGTAPKGLVLAFDGKTLQVLRDLEPQEVVGIVAREDGGLIVAANADEAGGDAQRLGSLLGDVAEPDETKPGQKARERASLQDGVIVHLEATGAVTTLWTQKKTAVLSLTADGAGAVAGTYPSGRVIAVEPGRPYALAADLPEAEASVLVSAAGHFAAVITSNPAVLHTLDQGVTRGSWTSAPVDAGAVSRWGRVSLWGRGVTTLSYRSGATSEPDATWSAWATVQAFDGSAGAMDVAARFVQWRAVLEGAEAELRAVTAVVQAPNRAPVILELDIKKPGEKEGDAPVATPKREITWKTEDADDDELRATIEVNRKGSPHWITLVDAKELDKPKYEWDTTGLPDGDYEIVLRVDDGAVNDPGRMREARQVLTAVRIDNTPPTVRANARRHGGGRGQVEGTAADANGGRIFSVRVSLNGGPWIPLGAKDGLYDGDREAFDGIVRVPENGGAQDVVVQVMDADGNVAAGAAVLR